MIKNVHTAMKEKILEKLKIARGENTSTSDRTLETLAAILSADITEETMIDATIEKFKPILAEIDGNISAVAAKAVKDLKQPTNPIVPPMPPLPPTEPVEPEWVKAYKEEQEELKKRLINIEKEKQTEEMVASAKRIFYDKYQVSDAEKALCEKSLALHLKLSPAPESTEKIIEGWKSQYEDIRSAQGLGGLVPVGSNSGGGSGAGNEALKGLKEKLQREGKIPASQN